MPGPPDTAQRSSSAHAGFTLVELLVVISIIALLIAILIPSMRHAREQGRSTLCLTRMHTLGQGVAMYALDHNDALLPSRMPNLGDGINWQTEIAGGMKYRPTFIAMMGTYLNIPPFTHPSPVKSEVDPFGEKGDRQNYDDPTYTCPSVPTWTDERNGCFGWNFQFLGNSRLLDENDITSFKNWPVRTTHIKSPSGTVAVADCTGTAASYAVKRSYDNNSKDPDRYGNEGFNLDPPRVDPVNGEMAEYDGSPQARTAVHDRHLGKAGVLWLDAHGTKSSAKELGYDIMPDGVITFEGNNRYFSADGTDTAWVVD